MSQSTHNLIDSLKPEQSSVVYSSAGSGKTWLLIARILRLLIAGADPRSILAITFTRKAVGEMHERLQIKLQNWAFIEDAHLKADLETIGLVEVTPKTLSRARMLYEYITLQDNSVYITTFHAFCHDVQKTFPLESPLPIGFTLTEQTYPVFSQALQILYQRATENQQLQDQLESLFTYCDGPRGTEVALRNFWLIRNEWKLFALRQKQPCDFALKQLDKIYKDSNMVNDGATQQLSECLSQYVNLLKQSDTATHQKSVRLISDFLLEQNNNPFALSKCFLYSGQLQTKPLKASKKLRAALGADNTDTLESLHMQIGERIILGRDQELHQILVQANNAWWAVGNELLQCYQELKITQGLADFDDLEFETYRLMQSQEHASWLQYKLGSKLQHLLVDEFQDTNTFQWKLLQPLIQAALESSVSPSACSVFLVGDVKQSIYRFRRANPAIMQSALQWCKQHFPCMQYSNNISWRSGPAIIDFINQAFSAKPLKDKLANFQPHQCQQNDLWSRVEVHPLFTNDESSSATYMRNPLSEPRHPFAFSNRYREGSFIAKRIQSMISNRFTIKKDGKSAAIQYEDIIILTRNRTHLGEYEQALRDHGLPFASNDAGYWLHRLEIRDIRCLLAVLDFPFDDLKLSQVLRSPIFAVSSNELLTIRHENEYLFDAIASEDNLPQSVAYAYTKICEWGNLANRVPVQDLLDKIYFEWNVIQRYQSISPPSQHALIKHYLDQFIGLSLSIDSGRYPNIQRFLSAVALLETELVDQYQDAQNQLIRLLTVHGAKGLEAPVVFLADTGPASKPPAQLPTIVDWPEENEIPALIALTKNDQSLDSKMRSIKAIVNQPNEDEDFNLLYVAVTRARQMLVITGSSSGRGSSSWHELLTESIGQTQELSQTWELESGTPLKASTTRHAKKTRPLVEILPSLRKQDPVIKEVRREKVDTEQAIYGTFLHKCLELLSDNQELSMQTILNIFNLETGLLLTTEIAGSLYHEALNCIHDERCQALFFPPKNAIGRNEVPILNCNSDNHSLSIIDRLIIYPESIWIVDYKSHNVDLNSNLATVVDLYRPQINRYRQTIETTYPDHKIRCSILFTKIAHIVDL